MMELEMHAIVMMEYKGQMNKVLTVVLVLVVANKSALTLEIVIPWDTGGTCVV